MSGTKNNRERKKAGPPGQPRRSAPEHRGPSSSSGETVEVAGSGVESASGEALPEGWATDEIGEVASIVTGKTPSTKKKAEYYDGGTIPFVKPGDLDREAPLLETETYVTEEGATQAPSLPDGSVLVSCIGNLGKVALLGRECICNQQINAILPSEALASKYTYYWAQTIRDWMEENASATTVTILNKGRFSNAPIRIAPKAEQSRIVSAIESLQERSSRARDLLSEVGPLIGQLRQSVLRGAFSGRLTADWRAANPDVQPASELLASIRTERRASWEAEQLAKYEAKGKKPPKNWQDKYKEPEPVDESELPELPKGWCWADFETIAEIEGGLTRHKEKRAAAKEVVPLISVAAVQHGYIDSSQVGEIGLLPSDGDKATLKTGDLLIVEGNGSLEHIGRAALWDDSIPNVRHQNHLIRVRPMLIDPAYALHWLASPIGREMLVEEATSAAGLYNLSLSKIGRICVPIAPIAEQVEIVRLVDEVRASLRESTEGVASMESSLTQLDQSILSKAFRGELVPQDPRDEPASELLARIRTTREKLEAEKKAAKKKSKTRKRKAAN